MICTFLLRLLDLLIDGIETNTLIPSVSELLYESYIFNYLFYLLIDDIETHTWIRFLTNFYINLSDRFDWCNWGGGISSSFSLPYNLHVVNRFIRFLINIIAIPLKTWSSASRFGRIFVISSLLVTILIHFSFLVNISMVWQNASHSCWVQVMSWENNRRDRKLVRGDFQEKFGKMAVVYLSTSNVPQRTRPADSNNSQEYIPLCHL
jgi:hypothetical protein